MPTKDDIACVSNEWREKAKSKKERNKYADSNLINTYWGHFRFKYILSTHYSLFCRSVSFFFSFSPLVCVVGFVYTFFTSIFSNSLFVSTPQLLTVVIKKP